MVTPLPLKKTPLLRRRFLKGPLLKGVDSWETWQDEAHLLRNKILTDSTYQLIGEKVILRVDENGKDAQILIEVQGIPQLGLEYQDSEPGDLFTHEFEKSIFETDFSSVRERGERLGQKIAQGFPSKYDIVIEGQHLALHFFK